MLARGQGASRRVALSLSSCQFSLGSLGSFPHALSHATLRDDVQELSLDERNSVVGGMTQNQCIALWTIGGGLVGGFVGGISTAGAGTVAWAGLGMAGGGALGLAACKS